MKLSASIVLGLFLLSAPAVWASNLSISPSSLTVTKNQSFSVEVKLNADPAINAVSAYLSYPNSNLDFLSIDSSSSDLGITAEESESNGIIKITRGSTSAKSGSLSVAKINFRAKNMGNSTLNFISGSAAPSYTSSLDTLNLSSSTGATVTVNPIKLDGDNLTKCLAKEDTLKDRIQKIINDLRQKYSRFEAIKNEVNNFSNGNVSSTVRNGFTYTNKLNILESKKNETNSRLNEIQQNSSNFSCSSDDPKDYLNGFKNDTKNAIQLLKEFRQDLKDYIYVVKNNS